jgi:hypothetical protein
MSDLEPMDPELRSLLDAAKPADAAPDTSRARLEARLVAGLALGAGAAAGGGALAAKAGAKAALAHLALPVLVAFTLGGAVGAAVMRATFTPPAPQVVYVDRPVPAPSAPTEPPPPVPSASASATAAPPVPAPSPASSRGDSVAAERRMLDGARLALERGDGAAALAEAERHARTFPTGALVQEREAIAIRALVMLGRRDDAQARARRFVVRFPDSLLRPAVEAAVANP